ncbi:MAG: hypothetical protein PHS57_07365 [Alphaproteobacteria bacterium]|nr:hypothetical protein [Alphaproteobacteria bacterium]
MYMVAFLALLVALIGTFTQVHMNQASSSMAQQSGVVESLASWHATAVDLAQKYINTASASECSMTCETLEKAPGALSLSTTTEPVAVGGLSDNASINADVWWRGPGKPHFPDHEDPPVVQKTSVSLCSGSSASCVWDESNETICSGEGKTPCFSVLPSGYNMNYKFYSIEFKNTDDKYYVLTFVPPPASKGDAFGVGLLCLPGKIDETADGPCPSPQKQVSMTFSNLSKEMEKTGLIPPTAYGTVKQTGKLTPHMTLEGTTKGSYYTVPSVVPVGSLGVITEVVPCSNCSS